MSSELSQMQMDENNDSAQNSVPTGCLRSAPPSVLNQDATTSPLLDAAPSTVPLINNMLASLANPRGGGSNEMCIKHHLGELQITHTVGDWGKVMLAIICLCVVVLTIRYSLRKDKPS